MIPTHTEVIIPTASAEDLDWTNLSATPTLSRAEQLLGSSLKAFLNEPTSSVDKLIKTQISYPQIPIRAEQILVISKDSKVDYDCQRLGLNREELRNYYDQQGADTERIFSSHERQRAAQQKLIESMPAGRIVDRAQVLALGASGKLDALLASSKLVLAFGGDNHFQWVAEQIKNHPQLLLMGVNSDALTSHGQLLQIEAKELDKSLEQIAAGNYAVQDWSRLHVQIGDHTEMLAFSEIFIGERQRTAMSRNHILLYDIAGNLVESYEDKSSGLLIATGAGASGWIKGAGGTLAEAINIERGSQLALVLSTETFSIRPQFQKTEITALTPLNHVEYILPKGGSLVVESLNDSEGIVSCDSQREVSFPRVTSQSNRAVIKLSEQPLRILSPSLPESGTN